MSINKMDEPTLIALRGSIAKWEAIVAGTGGDEGYRNCPLCEAFMNEVDEAPDEGTGDRLCCSGCPVRAAVGASECECTPYTAWARAVPFDGPLSHRTRRATTAEHFKLAQAELEFLRSLLPSNQQEL